MTDPYRILGLTRADADDNAVRAAYLEGLRAHPPERDPDAFQKLRGAYEQLSTHRKRLQHALFVQDVPTVDDIADRLLVPGPPRRASAASIRRALAAGLGMNRS